MDARKVLCVVVKRRIRGGLPLQKRNTVRLDIRSMCHKTSDSVQIYQPTHTVRKFVLFVCQPKNVFPIFSYSYFIQLTCDLSEHTL
jgi:hypothetical protein